MSEDTIGFAEGNAKVFVYGTLQNGLGGRTGQFVSKAWTVDKFSLAHYGFPAAYFSSLKENEGYIRGEIYEITPEILRSLDQYEGCPDLFLRLKVLVQDEDGHVHRCWVYVGNEVLNEPPMFVYEPDKYQTLTWSKT